MELKKRIKIALATQLYIRNMVSIGKASQIAELSRLEFETVLSESKIPISNLGYDDILRDIQKLR